MKILITEDLWGPLPDWFQVAYNVTYDPDLYANPAKMATYSASVQALVVRNKTVVSESLLEQFPNLKIVGRLGVGLDNIDLTACKERDINVIAARGFNANAVAEYVFAAMFEHARFLRASDASIKLGVWDRRLGTGIELNGKTLGLIGVGDIGQRVALRANAMAMNVLAFDPFLLDSNMLLQDCIVKRVELEELFRRSDYISIHVPLMPTTLHLISDRELKLMKEDVVLINTSRGGIVDEVALLTSLRMHPNRLVVLDVREQEPPNPTDELTQLENILLSPHIAGITRESSKQVTAFILQQIDNKLKGESVQGIVV